MSTTKRSFMKGCLTEAVASLFATVFVLAVRDLLNPGFNGDKQTVAIVLGVAVLLFLIVVAYRRRRARRGYQGYRG